MGREAKWTAGRERGKEREDGEGGSEAKTRERQGQRKANKKTPEGHKEVGRPGERQMGREAKGAAGR